MQPEGNTLRYLGLPGADLLDLRYFHSTVCEPNGMHLRFLGFNVGADPKSGLQTEANISLDEVRKLSKIDPCSDIVWDDFSRIANENSIAWKKALDFGPYDVVNLDLCDGFCADPPGALDDTLYNAINKLLTLQSRNRNPWLLLLTTRAGRRHTHAEVLRKLLQKYAQNLANCAPFRDVSKGLLGIEDEPTLQTSARTPDGLLSVFLIGLCKWMLGLAVGQQPPSEFEVRSVIGYRVEREAAHEDLISLALRFNPTFAPGVDDLGLANQAQVLPDECELSVKALKRIAKRKDADAILRDDEELYKEMVSATASLLEAARYDPNAFGEWAAQIRDA